MMKVLAGKDKYDLDKQQWEWQSANPKVIIRKVYRDEDLPLKVVNRRFGEKLPPAADRVSRRIDYDG
jgi:hypothetical protein